MFKEATYGLNKVYSTLTQAGYECYLVGGAVRNFLCGDLDSSDFDIATDARPEEVIALFRRVIPTGIKHGTVTVFVRGERFEVTTYRLDGKYSDGRRPDQIHFVSGILEDLKRRDFTMNSVAYELGTKTFLDPNKGIEDINNKIIRAIGSPLQRFQEDGLRPLRAIRFVSQLGFSIEKETYQAICESVRITCMVSKERIISEFFRLIQGPQALRGLLLVRATGLLSKLVPEFDQSYLFISRKQEISFLRFLGEVLRRVGPTDLELRIAVIFALDVKYFMSLSSAWNPSDHSYETRVAQCLAVGRRYRFSNKTLKVVAHFVRWSSFPYGIGEWDDARVRIFVHDVGINNLDRLFILWQAVSCLDETKMNIVCEAHRRISNLLRQPGVALSIRDLAIDGEKLIESLNLREGRVVGQILNMLLERVLEDPSLNNEPALLDIAQNLLK